MAKKRSLGIGLGGLIPDKDSINVAPSKTMLDGAATTKSAVTRTRKPVNGAVGTDILLGRAQIREELMQIPGVRYAELKLNDVVPNAQQPREYFDDDYLAELAASIKEFGVIQPIRVREILENGLSTGKYELIAGERRLRASKIAGKVNVPAIIADVQDDNMLSEALIENLHRVNLNPLEVASAYRQLMDDFSLTQEQLSKKIGTSRSRIANTLRMLKLPLEIQKRVASGVLSEGHARAIIGVKDLTKQLELATRIIQEGLSVRNVEELVAIQNGQGAAIGKKIREKALKEVPKIIKQAEDDLADYLDTTVQIRHGSKHGQIVITYADISDLKRLVFAIEN